MNNTPRGRLLGYEVQHIFAREIATSNRREATEARQLLAAIGLLGLSVYQIAAEEIKDGAEKLLENFSGRSIEWITEEAFGVVVADPERLVAANDNEAWRGAAFNLEMVA